MKKIEPEEANENKPLGWNCFDVAVGLGGRKEFVDYALDHATEENYRTLLAPEIRHAATLTFVYLTLKEEADREKVQNIAELLGLVEALERTEEKHSVIGKLEKLIDEKTEQDDLSELSCFILPSCMHTSELKECVKNYTQAHEDMREAVAICNDALGHPEGKRLSLGELNVFFEDEQHRSDDKKAYTGFKEKRDSLFTSHEQAFYQYCERKEIYEQYVRTYYGKQGWFAFQRGFQGEHPSTSMVDIAALYLNKQIVIYQNEEGEDKEIYRTVAYRRCIQAHIRYESNNHFVAIEEKNRNQLHVISKKMGHVTSHQLEAAAKRNKVLLQADVSAPIIFRILAVSLHHFDIKQSFWVKKPISSSKEMTENGVKTGITTMKRTG